MGQPVCCNDLRRGCSSLCDVFIAGWIQDPEIIINGNSVKTTIQGAEKCKEPSAAQAP